MKLYAAAITARRDRDGETEIQTTAAVLLVVSEDEVRNVLRDAADSAFPPAEGWTDYQASLTEIPDGMELGNYHITWTARHN
jgi:hypothetical protein